MSVMALDREDVSWVHNQYSSLKLIYQKNDSKRKILLLSALWGGGIAQLIRTALPLFPCPHLNQTSIKI
jgi:hypothetical protein